MARQAGTRRTIDRDQVIDTALKQVEEHGAEGLTLTGIANELGVTQPALYGHVDGLDDIWRELGLRIRQELAATLADACVGLAAGDAVHSVGHAWRQFGLARPRTYHATDRYRVAGDPDLEAAVDQVISVLGAAVRGFGLTDDLAVHAARMLRSTLHGFVTFEVDGGHPKPHEPDDTFEHILDLLVIGFSSLSNHASEGVPHV